MKIEYHNWESEKLGHGMELKVYGHAGTPMMVFPSSRGRFYDYENNGMIDSITKFIESGQIIVFTVDGIDWQTWFNDEANPSDRAHRHNHYDNYVYEEVIPFIFKYPGVDERATVIVSGCSFGGYHSINFFLRHPNVVSTVIALSGVYSVNFSVGDYVDENVVINDPIRYLSELKDPEYLKMYRESEIIISVGQGGWEDWMLLESKKLSKQFNRLGIDHWLDLWGHDVNHDWPWWRKQIVYFLEKAFNKSTSQKDPNDDF